MIPDYGWLLLAYVAGTAFGMWASFQNAIAKTIDALIDQGYLKTRKKSDGEIEILKYNED